MQGKNDRQKRRDPIHLIDERHEEGTYCGEEACT